MALTKFAKLLVLGTVISLSFLELTSAQTNTIKTNHTDVNLWDGAGRGDHKSIGQVKRFEEIQVLKSQTLPNGETWHQVQFYQQKGGRRVTLSGWVDAKFFTKIDNPVEADQPPESVTEARAKCVTCALPNSPTENAVTKNQASLSAIVSPKFIWPVTGEVRSGFGYRRHPIKGIVKEHRGTDISRNNGQKVRASKGGVVIKRQVAARIEERAVMAEREIR